MNVRDMRKPKLCHAEIGGLVQLLDDNFDPLPDMYLVCVAGKTMNKWKGAMSGLYSEDNPLFLVNIRTGEAQKMPRLSSKVVILNDAELHLVDKPKKITLGASQFIDCPRSSSLSLGKFAEEIIKHIPPVTPPNGKFIAGQRVLLDDMIVTIVRVSPDGRKLTIRRPDYNHDNEVMEYRVTPLPNGQL